MRFLFITAALAATLVSGCGESPTAPVPNPGHYVLVSVNDQAVPATLSLGSGSTETYTYELGDLLLRPDGTFVLGAASLVAGTYTVDGTRLNFAGTARSDRLDAVIAGDSVVIALSYTGTINSGDTPSLLRIQGTTRLLFRRATFGEPSAASGTYTLATVNGQGAPLTLLDSMTSRGRVTHVVRYDSLTFIDGIFFRRRLQVDFYLNGTLDGGLGAAPNGSVRPQDNAVLATSYSRYPAYTGLPFADRLEVDGSSLVRHTALTNRTREERYTRP